jgi:hypothetical protein
MVIPGETNFRKSWWHNRDYGVIVANAFGRRAMKQGEPSQHRIPQGKTFELGYRVVIHTYPNESASLSELAKQWRP